MPRPVHNRDSVRSRGAGAWRRVRHWRARTEKGELNDDVHKRPVGGGGRRRAAAPEGVDSMRNQGHILVLPRCPNIVQPVGAHRSLELFVVHAEGACQHGADFGRERRALLVEGCQDL